MSIHPQEVLRVHPLAKDPGWFLPMFWKSDK
jgi:hypothetical protein